MLHPYLNVPGCVNLNVPGLLNFENTDYIFMCGRGDGSGLHNFATTLREHNNNKKVFKRNVGFN